MPMEQPPMDMMPPDMGGGDMGGNFMPQDNMGGMPPMDNGMGGGQSEFDTNFDAGVEADEDQDPKKFIQQLTGKLSQSLRKYNDNNGQPDIDLNKYVAGMIVKQAMEGLSQDDADDIIDKVKADENPDMGENGNQDNGQFMNEPPQQEMQMGNNPQQVNEKISRKHSRQIKEIVNGVLDGFKKNEEDTIMKKSDANDGKVNFKRKPFTSKSFTN